MFLFNIALSDNLHKILLRETHNEGVILSLNLKIYFSASIQKSII